MTNEKKIEPCNLSEILTRAAAADRMVDVQDSAAVTIHKDDAYKIGDCVRVDIPAMADEILMLRDTVQAKDAEIARLKAAMLLQARRLDGPSNYDPEAVADELRAEAADRGGR